VQGIANVAGQCRFSNPARLIENTDYPRSALSTHPFTRQAVGLGSQVRFGPDEQIQFAPRDSPTGTSIQLGAMQFFLSQPDANRLRMNPKKIGCLLNGKKIVCAAHAVLYHYDQNSCNDTQ
jgi:hypothetical protein